MAGYTQRQLAVLDDPKAMAAFLRRVEMPEGSDPWNMVDNPALADQARQQAADDRYQEQLAKLPPAPVPVMPEGSDPLGPRIPDREPTVESAAAAGMFDKAPVGKGPMNKSIGGVRAERALERTGFADPKIDVAGIEKGIRESDFGKAFSGQMSQEEMKRYAPDFAFNFGLLPTGAPRGAVTAGPNIGRMLGGREATSSDVARAVREGPLPIEPGELRASTRFPSAVKSTEDPLRQHLNIGVEEMKLDPEGFSHNMSLIPEYPGFGHLRGKSPEEIARGYIDQASGNMRFLYENAPQAMRERSPRWYEGANRFADALAERYGIPRQSASAAIAALSPQMDWFKNASLAERVGDIIMGPASSKLWTPDMLNKGMSIKSIGESERNLPILQSIAGKRYSELTDPVEKALWVRLYDETYNPRFYREMTPEGALGNVMQNQPDKRGYQKTSDVGWGALDEIAKAVRAYESGGDMDVISRMLGGKHKVRSFYNNIELPFDPRFGDITADTHQVAAAQLRPLSGSSPEVVHNLASTLMKKDQPPGYRGPSSSSVTGVQGTYGLTADATSDAARQLGLLAREAQSSTWEPVRELFSPSFKSATKRGTGVSIDDIWRAVDRGEMSVEQARRQVLEAAGGIGEPSWLRRGSGAVDPRRSSTYR
jgi:hypothetical protein